MNIGFDAKRYFHNRTGLGNYSRDLVSALVSSHPEDNFFLFDTKPAIDGLPPNVIAVPPGDGIRLVKGSLLWRTFYMRRDMFKYRLDIFHGLSNELPFGKYKGNVKKVVTIHDVIFDVFPGQYAWIDRQIYRRKTRHAVEIADKIIVTSKATADDLKRFYKVDASKIEVVYQTCGESHRKVFSEQDIQAFKSKHKLPDKSFLYVSSFQTRKNHLSLLKAFAMYKGNTPLVLAGKPGETLSICKRFISENQLQNKVIVIEGLGNEELPLLYRACSYFVYPSMIEGFGIPLIEAAQAGLPVAVNDIPIFRELAPDGSLYFNANDEIGFSKVLEELEKSDKMDYGAYLNLFDPALAAEKVHQIYRSLI